MRKQTSPEESRLSREDQHILRLHREGWHVPNIASIAHSTPGHVRKVLQFHGIEPLM
ncbi:MAG: hypothetical protein IJ243_12120 [Prevotella sp.]|nr:hypothetical protein [Prevotella sp.]